MAPQLLWIGLGNMGRGMSKNLVEKGSLDKPLLLYNRSTKRTTDHSAKLPEGKSAVVTDLASGVAKADVIILCVADDAAVEHAVDTALQSGSSLSGKLFIDCSTIHPDTTEKVAASLTAAGASFVAAPVFGPPAAADAGRLISVLAGPSSSVERARPYFKGVTSVAEVDMSGKPPGTALKLKLIGNTFVVNMVEQLAEALVLAEKSGLGVDPIQQLMNAMFPGPYAAYAERMTSGDYHRRGEPLFAVDLARKDARHAMSLAEAARTRVQNVETADAHLVVVKEHCGEKGDIAGIYGAVRKEAGLKFEN